MQYFYLHLNIIVLQSFIYCIHINKNKTQINNQLKCVTFSAFIIFFIILNFGDVLCLKIKYFEEKCNLYGSHSRDTICVSKFSYTFLYTLKTRIELLKYSLTLVCKSLDNISIWFLKMVKIL